MGCLEIIGGCETVNRGELIDDGCVQVVEYAELRGVAELEEE